MEEIEDFDHFEWENGEGFPSELLVLGREEEGSALVLFLLLVFFE